MSTSINPITHYKEVINHLRHHRYRWVVTGAAGFIGSHLTETLLAFNQAVIGIDNFSTGYSNNLNSIKQRLSAAQWASFEPVHADISDLNSYSTQLGKVDFVLHQAALASVPRSIKEPIETHKTNVEALVTWLEWSRHTQVTRFIYASSSAVYGDSEHLPKTENMHGNLLSPYAVSKRIGELYAGIYARCYGLNTVGLRYFNIYGPRQDPKGAYAAVIPKWVEALKNNKPIVIYGDGETTRDFCYVADVVQANLLAALVPTVKPGSVFNVAQGTQTSLNQLFYRLKALISDAKITQPTYQPFREGDVIHSVASIEQARTQLGYAPRYSLESGLQAMLNEETPIKEFSAVQDKML